MLAFRQIILRMYLIAGYEEMEPSYYTYNESYFHYHYKILMQKIAMVA